MFFLSSPPQPPPQQPQFFANPFAFTHSPTTPSPLRTSYNANGVKRARMSDHNTQPNSQSSPLHKASAASSISWPTQPGNESQNENIFSTSTLQFHPTDNSSNSPLQKPSQPFAFATRASAASPANQLAARAAATKANNKARFLDRLRTRREQGTGRDDKVMRADYLEEKRRWEQEMRERAGLEGGEGMDMEGVDAEGMMEEAEEAMETREMSPTEEREIEELVGLLERDEEQMCGGAGYCDGDGDSQEWDDVFMEVLSQQESQVLSQNVQGEDGGADVDMS